MEDEYELKINAALPKALGIVVTDGLAPTPDLVVAACLQRLAVGTGLAQRDDPMHSVVRSAGLPAPALRLLAGFFDGANGTVSDDQLRNGLYDALVALSESPGVLRAINRSSPLTGDELLEFAQIYWNLDAEEPRSRLPIRVGQNLSDGSQAYLKVDGADEDYAGMNLKQRADRTPGYAGAAGAFYERAARVAGFVAKQVVTDGAQSVDGAALRSARTGRGAEWSVVWSAKKSPSAAPATEISRPNALTNAPDPTVALLQQLRQRNVDEGDFGEAAILCTTLIAILRERSEKSPGDHESQLADEYLQGGLTFAMNGRTIEALDHLANAERAIETLSDLHPTEPMYWLQLAVTRTMIGVMLFYAGMSEEAELSLADAVRLAQALTDEDAGNEDMLAASLGMLGLVYVQTGQLDQATKTLDRAVKISQKLAAKHPNDRTGQLQLASTLATFAGLQYHQDQTHQAEESLTRSLSIAEELAEDGVHLRMANLLIANNRLVLGTIYLYADRFEEAEVLAGAVSLARALVDRHPDEPAQVTLAGALSTLGLLRIATDRMNEGEQHLIAAVNASRDLLASGERAIVDASQTTRATTFLGSSLYYLGLLYLDSAREDAAESTLVDAVAVFEQRPDDVGDQKMLVDALQALADLYLEQGRLADADRAIERRRRLDDQSPDAPALA